MTAFRVDSNLDLQQLQLLNAAIQNLSTAPGTPVSGQVWFDTVAGAIKVWDGSAWQVLDARKVANGAIPIGKLDTDPLARANHTGSQLASTVSNFDTQVRTSRLDQMAVPNTSVSFNSQRATGLADASSATDAVTLQQMQAAVDLAAAGIDSKPSVRAISTTNISLSGAQTIDGVAVTAGQRVLVAGQTTGSQNGPYVVASGAWTRATDGDNTGEITPGATWYVEEGTVNGATQWRVSNTGAITVGTTAITIVLFNTATTYANGAGLGLTGTTFSVTAGVGIVADGTSTRIDKAIVPRWYTGLAGSGSAGPYNVNHALATNKVSVTVRDAASPFRVHQVAWSIVDTNNLQLEPDITWASNAMQVVVIGGN